MVDLPIRIQEKRMEMGFNKSKLGALLGISGTAIKQYEDGKNYPKTEVLLALSKLLKWDFINDKPMENDANFNRNENITYNENINQRVNKSEEIGFSDNQQGDKKVGWDTNITFPDRDLSANSSNEWRMLYINQQELIKLLNQQIELLNKLIQR